MRTASLLAVLMAARAISLAGHALPATAWSVVAYLWHDAAVVLAWTVLDTALAKRPRAAWTVYGLLVLYLVINIPVVRAVSTPLTWAMWRAAGGPMTDSFRLYVTWTNVLLIVMVLATAALAPIAFRRVPARPLAAVLAAFVALGPFAQRHVDTHGLERNAWSALAVASIRHISAAGSAAQFDPTWHAQPASRQDDLQWLRAAAAGRNIILVSLESTAAQYLGLYGAQPDPTPHLSALARSAVVFESAYAVYPESIKGLFSILCSVYPALDSPGESYANAPCAALPQQLHDRGYRTALFHSGRFGYLGMEAVIRNRGFDTLTDAGDIGGNRQSSFGVDEPATVDRILRWIDDVPSGQPFFVAYLPIAGHHPYETPEPGPFPDIEQFDRYRNALHLGDTALGALIEGVRARHLDSRTLWIVLGDHGEAFGQHHENYGHTFHLYEENIRVPFLIAAAGLSAEQTRVRRVVSLIDTAPTVLDLIGAPSPNRYQGRTMLDPSPRLALFFADYSLGLLGVRDGARKVIYDIDTNRARLFRLDADPGELVDRSSQEPAVAQRYAQNLRAWSLAQRALLRASTLPQK